MTIDLTLDNFRLVPISNQSTKAQGNRNVHKSTLDTLPAVPCYSDLLDNQGDEDEAEQG